VRLATKVVGISRRRCVLLILWGEFFARVRWITLFMEKTMIEGFHGRLMLDLDGTVLADNEVALLQNPHVGGVILFSRNVVSRQQVASLVAQIRAVAPHLLIAVDQEGGRVQRFKEGFTSLPPMQLLGDAYLADPLAGLALSRNTGWLMAAEVIACGVDISFAPVLDVDRETSSIIGNRAFADDPDVVVAVSRAFIEGMNEAGMAATGKHFPGHGGIFADSHLEAPVDYRNWDALWQRDIVPFVALSGLLGGIMPAHITFPDVDPKSVGFSPFWLQRILREKLGFQGVIFSDDLAMKGADVAGGYERKAQLALEAGCDMILVCNDRRGALTVLQYMAEQAVSQSDKIGAMLKASAVTWSDLEADPRRIATTEQLKPLMTLK